ncbi:flagellar basal body L-ring protein FlgH [Pseudorhodoferax sp. Leaf274]|uniref:flagellar basal body L-ring protein FlgH n=1 Tax=Pseudorhodoferax sp. Leaf274 TaxID=1736318 RepID=UPI0009E9531E|nr:flagellar basal body L-ring protein FlgH [Pseudorhodoferax sp. Leaf274]
MHRPTAERPRGPAWAALLCTALALPGCALFQALPATPVQPSYAAPIPKPPNVERVNNGAIYQLGQPMVFSYAGRAKPRRIGDTLKVDIAENLASTNKIANSTSRENAVASKGPGTSDDSWSILKGILNLDVTASGSDSYKGSGSAENSSSFTGQLAASVINVLPNGNLLVAGERSVLVRGDYTMLRFSGIVDPKDLRDGNVVASVDVAQARVEVGGKGDISEAASRSWLQRVLTSTLSVW